MKIILTIILVILCLIFTNELLTKEVHYQRQEPVLPNYDSLTVKELIKLKAEKYNLSSNMMDEIILCESTYNPNAVHDGHRGVGVTGFHKSTFDLWLKKYEKETNQSLNYNSTFDQLELMSWAFSKGESYRDDWSSYNRYKVYGTCQVKKIKELANK